MNAAVAVEAIRTAQARFGKRPLNGEEGRWGLEHLNIDDARLKAMGYLADAASSCRAVTTKAVVRRACSSGTAPSGRWSATGLPPTAPCCAR